MVHGDFDFAILARLRIAQLTRLRKSFGMSVPSYTVWVAFSNLERKGEINALRVAARK